MEKEEIDIDGVGKGEEIGVKVADWLADKNRIPGGVVEGTVEAVTEKAVLVNDEWIPKSQVEKAWNL